MIIRDTCEFNNLIEKTQAINKRDNTISKRNNILLEDSGTLLDRMNKLKNESKKRMEGSSKFSKEYEVRNDKIDKTIGKPKIVRDTCEFDILIENTNELIKTTVDNC